MRRRDFLKTNALAAVTGLGLGETAGKAQGSGSANDRIGIGMIGVGGFGTHNLRTFKANPDVDIVAVCDANQIHLDRAVGLADGKARSYRDYRRLLEDPAVDAVVIATPEHWHAMMSIDACDAGKDVYVEKPASHNIRDGRLMVEVARRNDRVVQVGTQQRSGAHFQRAVRLIQEGRIGDVHYACCWNHSPPRAPRPTVTGGPPPELDWDLWLGPAPETPYAEVMNVGRRGYWAFWGGMITEWGTHLADLVLWAMKVRGPKSVVAAGGRFHQEHGEIPDTLQVLYNYPTFLFQYSVLNHNTYGLNGDLGAARFGSYGMQFQGTRGTLFIDREGFRISPQPTRREEPNQPSLPPTAAEPSPWFHYTNEILPEHSDTSEQHGPHVRNFLDCIKTRRRPNADIEFGHYANTVCRLANIAYRLGRRLEWDAEREEVIGDPEANKLVVGTYREPWVPRGL